MNNYTCLSLSPDRWSVSVRTQLGRGSVGSWAKVVDVTICLRRFDCRHQGLKLGPCFVVLSYVPMSLPVADHSSCTLQLEENRPGEGKLDFLSFSPEMVAEQFTLMDAVSVGFCLCNFPLSLRVGGEERFCIFPKPLFDFYSLIPITMPPCSRSCLRKLCLITAWAAYGPSGTRRAKNIWLPQSGPLSRSSTVSPTV